MEPAEINKTLQNNNINYFLLRIDFVDDTQLDLEQIMNNISKNYDRVEKKIKHQLKFNMQKLESKYDEYNIYSLIDEDNGITLEFNKIENAIALIIKKYINKSSYISKINDLIKIINETYPNTQTKRIGMRFINKFPCRTKNEISKILDRNTSKIIKTILEKENTSRIIILEEYNYFDSKIHVQYGILNKTFPSIINDFDISIDIDSFDDITYHLDSINDILDKLNHRAYEKFIEFINPKYISKLK